MVVAVVGRLKKEHVGSEMFLDVMLWSSFY
jgi:hypothetical protein